MFASFTMYVIWLLMTGVALWIVISGGLHKGCIRRPGTTDDPNRVNAKR